MPLLSVSLSVFLPYSVLSTVSLIMSSSHCGHLLLTGSPGASLTAPGVEHTPTTVLFKYRLPLARRSFSLWSIDFKKCLLATELLIHRKDLIGKPLDSLSTIKKIYIYKCLPHYPPLIPFPVSPSPPLYPQYPPVSPISSPQHRSCWALTVSVLWNWQIPYCSTLLIRFSTVESHRKDPTCSFILWNTWHNFGSY